jgi:hypothetical protein
VIEALVLASAFAGRPQALPDCLGKPRVRPAEVVLACADANFGVRKLRWTGWGQPFAAATGVAYANDCKPNCAAGHMHQYQAVLVASGSQRCPGDVTAYSRVTIAFVGPSPYPKGRAADMVYPTRCR